MAIFWQPPPTESWRNPDGIVSTIASDVKLSDGRIVDRIRVMIPFHDIADFEQKLFSARLSEDGASFYLTMPSVPYSQVGKQRS